MIAPRPAFRALTLIAISSPAALGGHPMVIYSGTARISSDHVSILLAIDTHTLAHEGIRRSDGASLHILADLAASIRITDDLGNRLYPTDIQRENRCEDFLVSARFDFHDDASMLVFTHSPPPRLSYMRRRIDLTVDQGDRPPTRVLTLTSGENHEIVPIRGLPNSDTDRFLRPRLMIEPSSDSVPRLSLDIPFILTDRITPNGRAGSSQWTRRFTGANEEPLTIASVTVVDQNDRVIDPATFSGNTALLRSRVEFNTGPDTDQILFSDRPGLPYAVEVYDKVAPGEIVFRTTLTTAQPVLRLKPKPQSEAQEGSGGTDTRP